jgi:hypothetical protein
MFILIFVHWKKGPKVWRQISPYVYFSLIVFAYVLMPLANLVLGAYLWIAPNIDLQAEMLESYIVFCIVLYTIRLFEFFFIIRRTVLPDARTYLANIE